MKRSAIAFLLFTLFLLFPSGAVWANPMYAEQTGQSCAVCHIDGTIGLTPFGEAFQSQGYSWPGTDVKNGEEPVHRYDGVVVVLRFFHIMAAFIWIGAILYIHLVLTPKSVKHGIPTSTLRLAWVNIVLIFASGSLLILHRFNGIGLFLQTRFGTLLFIKVILFFILVLIAAVVTVRLNRLLRNSAKQSREKEDELRAGLKLFSRDELGRYDGKNGEKAYVAYDGTVYDISDSKLWQNGGHAGRHQAGTDLSVEMVNAPHGIDVLQRMPVVGQVAVEVHQQHQRPAKVFLALAYFNLIIIIFIIMILAIWRV